MIETYLKITSVYKKKIKQKKFKAKKRLKIKLNI